MGRMLIMDNNMKGVDSMGKYTLGLYEKSMPNTLSFAEKLLCAKECGFDYLEISIDETDEKLSTPFILLSIISIRPMFSHKMLVH